MSQTTKRPTKDERLRAEVIKLYCASGCSCCRDTEGWEAASNALGKMLGIEPYDDWSGHDWYAAKEALEVQNGLS